MNEKCSCRQICYPVYNLKKRKQYQWRNITSNFTKNKTPPWVFFTFFKLYKWYQIAQRITIIDNYRCVQNPVKHAAFGEKKRCFHLRCLTWFWIRLWKYHVPLDPESRTSAERLMYVQFTSCVQGVTFSLNLKQIFYSLKSYQNWKKKSNKRRYSRRQTYCY